MIMCGVREQTIVNDSILATSCQNAFNNCSNLECVRDYIRDNFDNRRHKFCPNRMNLLVTSGDWAKYAFGVKYASVNPYECIAYCTP